MRCCVNGCTNSILPLCSFPRTDLHRRKLWMAATGNPEMKTITSKHLLKNRRICSRHFEPQCFSGKKLSSTAVPTLFLPEPVEVPDVLEKVVSQIDLADTSTSLQSAITIPPPTTTFSSQDPISRSVSPRKRVRPVKNSVIGESLASSSSSTQENVLLVFENLEMVLLEPSATDAVAEIGLSEEVVTFLPSTSNVLDMVVLEPLATPAVAETGLSEEVHSTSTCTPLALMAKRTATRDINHENWDQEDEPEEAGTFKRASEEELKTRVIKTAKRRNLSAQGGEKSAFSAFAGFGKTQTPPTSSAFSFLSNVTSKTNGNSTAVPMFTMAESATERNSNLDEYYSKLKGLNESVANFIKSRVETNPFVNLQPVFKDYEKYINDLEKLKESLLAKNKDVETSTQAAEPEKPATTSFVFKPAARNSIESVKSPEKTEPSKPATTQPQFSFGLSSGKSIFSGTKPVTTGFSFGGADATKSATGFTFGGTDTTKSSTGFSFGTTTTASTPFTLSSKPAETQETKEEEEDSEPPKPEFTPVVEEGHVYTTRCKVFVKKDGSFADRGVGNLFLKPVPSSEKVQLIVRADTSLGNLLCNFILSSSIPIQRLGKKDVMLVCIPTPETKPPPVPLLLRVKSSEEADLLLEMLEKHKK